MATTDPFSEVYDALFDALVEQHEIEKRIVAKSRVRFDGDKPNPLQDKVAKADMPEVMLYPGRCVYNLTHTSSNGSIEQAFHLRIATADMRIDRDLFPVKWAAVRAVYQAMPTLGLDEVKRVLLSDSTERFEDVDANRGTPGWSTLLTITVTMFIARTRLDNKRGG